MTEGVLAVLSLRAALLLRRPVAGDRQRAAGRQPAPGGWPGTLIAEYHQSGQKPVLEDAARARAFLTPPSAVVLVDGHPLRLGWCHTLDAPMRLRRRSRVERDG
jgi:hypothetical protein